LTRALVVPGLSERKRRFGAVSRSLGCVLITVIAPDFVTGRPADLIALAIATADASRLPILPTVVIAIASAAVLRASIG